MSMREQLQNAVGKGHLSYSSIKYALGDMRLWEMYMRGELRKESEALTFGTLYDMLLFERKKAMDTYTIVGKDQILGKCSDKTNESPSHRTLLRSTKKLRLRWSLKPKKKA